MRWVPVVLNEREMISAECPYNRQWGCRAWDMHGISVGEWMYPTACPLRDSCSGYFKRFSIIDHTPQTRPEPVWQKMAQSPPNATTQSVDINEEGLHSTKERVWVRVISPVLGDLWNKRDLPVANSFWDRLWFAGICIKNPLGVLSLKWWDNVGTLFSRLIIYWWINVFTIPEGSSTHWQALGSKMCPETPIPLLKFLIKSRNCDHTVSIMMCNYDRGRSVPTIGTKSVYWEKHVSYEFWARVVPRLRLYTLSDINEERLQWKSVMRQCQSQTHAERVQLLASLYIP